VRVLGLDVLNGLTVRVEDIDAHDGVVEGWVGALYHLVIEMPKET
jgi:hypothetical protein